MEQIVIQHPFISFLALYVVVDAIVTIVKSLLNEGGDDGSTD